MKRALVGVMVLGLALSGCGFGKSRLNPFNWFGAPRQGAPVATYAAPQDTRGLIDTVVTLNVEPYTGGVIVRATGVPPTQGFWDAALVALPVDDKGQLVYEFRIKPPTTTAAAGTQPSREIAVAASVSTYTLQGISSITVQGARNALKARP
jgi:hypothetical protein